MSYPGGFGRGQAYSPLDNDAHQSPQQYESPGSYAHQQPFFSSGVGSASSGVGNASSGIGNASAGVGSASFSGIEMHNRPNAQHRHSVSSLYGMSNLPGPPPGPPPNTSQRPISMHYDSTQSSYSSGGPPRPFLPPRESVHFSDIASPLSPDRPEPPKRSDSSKSAYVTGSTLFPSPGTSKQLYILSSEQDLTISSQRRTTFPPRSPYQNRHLLHTQSHPLRRPNRKAAAAYSHWQFISISHHSFIMRRVYTGHDHVAGPRSSERGKEENV